MIFPLDMLSFLAERLRRLGGNSCFQSGAFIRAMAELIVLASPLAAGFDLHVLTVVRAWSAAKSLMGATK